MSGDSSSLIDHVLKREAMPGIEGLQATYVRYFRSAEAHALLAWQLPASLKNLDVITRNDNARLPPDHPLLTGEAPESISMKLLQSPAEFAVPVKQDKRLSPSFRVSVEVKFRDNGMAITPLPMTVRAFLMTQHEKDNILTWNPHQSMDKRVTELKGTTSVTHCFAGQTSKMEPPGPSTSWSEGTDMMNLGLHNVAMHGMQGGMQNAVQVLVDASGNVLNTSAAGLHMGSRHDPGMHHGMHHGSLGGGGAGLLRLQPAPDNTFSLVGLDNCYFVGQPGGGPGPMQQMQIMHEMPKQPGHPGAPMAQYMPAGTMSPRLTGAPMAHGQQPGQLGALTTLEHTYEFANLELVRPTRMNKVYMAFSCSIMDLDTIYLVYNVPTIGICRAEQREKACQKLNMPMLPSSVDAPGVPATSNSGGMSQSHPPSGSAPSVDLRAGGSGAVAGGDREAGGGGAHRVPKRDAAAAAPADPDSELATRRQALECGGGLGNNGSTPILGRCASGVLVDASSVALAAAEMHGADGGDGAAAPEPGSYTAASLREIIEEEYDATGLSRRLSELDVRALLSQAGFPAVGCTPATTISASQGEEFVDHLRKVLRLLLSIRHVWVLDDPRVVASFDMDRRGATRALAREPAGTFLCRFPTSQPGSLVLTCKTLPGHPCADDDSLLHAIVGPDDLRTRRIDKWILNFAGATHVLDPYRMKRVDKRKVFASDYLHLRSLDNKEFELEAPQESAAARSSPPMTTSVT